MTLANMHRPPKKLFMRGSWPDLSAYKFLCVIGSRKSSPYGQEACKKLVNGLRGYPISIVSGLAIGMDSLAHEAALEADLHCIAFPGSGLDQSVIYPPSRSKLAQCIVERGGALLSEYPPHYQTASWMFPARNRLMAGLSHAILIIEAGRGSGTLMTAKYGEDFNRDILAVPGQIFSELSYGPHMLIGKGAAPIFSANDIIAALGFSPKTNPEGHSFDLSKFEGTAKRILEILVRSDALHDDIMNELRISTTELNIQISELEMEGIIKVVGARLRLAV